MNKKELGALIGVFGTCGLIMSATFFVNNKVSKRVFHETGYVEAAATYSDQYESARALARDKNRNSRAFSGSSEEIVLKSEKSQIKDKTKEQNVSLESGVSADMDGVSAIESEEEAPVQAVNSEDRDYDLENQRELLEARERALRAEAEERARLKDLQKEEDIREKEENSKRKELEERENKLRVEAEKRAKERDLKTAKIESEKKEKVNTEKIAKEKTAKKETQNKENSSPKVYTLPRFKQKGVIIWGGLKFTYYSQKVLPGYNLKIPGRHVNADGFVCDKDGYIVLAHRTVARGTIINTPFGHKGKVYDRGYMQEPNHYDVYVD